MEKDSGISLTSLKVDGGMTKNELLMQFQSDILDLPVIRPTLKETSVLGAAYAAGLAVDYWKDKSELSAHWSIDRTWNPGMQEDDRKRLYGGWLHAIKQSCA